tara:strand:+ start:6692 stop:6964 length:273 start_codon:yes stop_codon:yes gene_type:complete
MNERLEALLRILVLIVTGIILGLWRIIIKILVVVHFVYAIITNERSRDIAEFSEIWSSQVYTYLRYITFVSNERPFPFNPLAKNISKFKK